jgi:hypothetical protein
VTSSKHEPFVQMQFRSPSNLSQSASEAHWQQIASPATTQQAGWLGSFEQSRPASSHGFGGGRSRHSPCLQTLPGPQWMSFRHGIPWGGGQFSAVPGEHFPTCADCFL